MLARCSERFSSLIVNRTTRILFTNLQGKVRTSASARSSGISVSTVIGVCSAATYAACRVAFVKPQAMEDSAQSTDKTLAEADELFVAVKYEELYEFLYKYKDEKNDEILWRLARAAYRKANLATTSKVDKERLLTDAKQYVTDALQVNEANFAAHKWASIVVVELAELHGTKAKIEQSIVSKEHMLRAHALNPKDGTTLYLLGVWCFTFADLSWHQRKLAGLIFASPPTSSYEEALQYFQKAEEAEPNFYSKNLLMLGKTLLKIKKQDVAISFLKRARDYLPKTDDDKQAKEEATALLIGLGIKN